MAPPLVTEGQVTLFQLDATMLGGVVHYFASAVDADHVVSWGGQEYAPMPMEASGFEITTRGAIPQPIVTISNLFGAGNTLLQTYNGLLGAKLARFVTLRRFLDDGSSPDGNAYIARDVYVVAQKTAHNAISITFKLASQMDQEGVELPRRQILRDICTHVYRVWNPTLGAYDYSRASCPYTGGGAWDPLNTPTTPQLDQCSRTITGCSLRFGGGVLPARFFPGVGRVK